MHLSLFISLMRVLLLFCGIFFLFFVCEMKIMICSSVSARLCAAIFDDFNKISQLFVFFFSFVLSAVFQIVCIVFYYFAQRCIALKFVKKLRISNWKWHNTVYCGFSASINTSVPLFFFAQWASQYVGKCRLHCIMKV